MAEKQHSVVASRQLQALGYTRPAIATRVRAGHLHPRHRGVYAVGHARLSTRGHWTAAVLACGPDALLSHYAAAALWGLQRPPSTRIDVTAPGKHNHTGIICHTARALEPRDRTVIDGIPVTSINRLLLDLAALQTPPRLRSTLEATQRRDLLNVRAVEELIARSSGHRGVKPLQAALAQLYDVAPWTQSELEQRFLELTRAAGLPEPSANVLVHGELVDFHWPMHHLVVEVDGYAFHKARRSVVRDRQRDLKLQLAGEPVVRVVYEQIQYGGEALVADLRILLGSTAA